MTRKPTQQEDEYFASLELERRQTALAERQHALAVAPVRRAFVDAEDTSFLDSIRRIFAYP